MQVKDIAITIVILLATMSVQIWACSFEEKFQWVKHSYEENFVGFQTVIDRKGMSAYDSHNQVIIQRIKSAKDLDECVVILRDWLRFFDDKHSGIYARSQQNIAVSENKQTVEPEYWQVDLAQFQEYLKSKTELDYEGIWDLGGQYKIGIVKEGNVYIGFVIETTNENWLPNMVKLKIEVVNDKVKSTFYAGDFSAETGEELIVLDNYFLRMVMAQGNTKWFRDLTRLTPEVHPNQDIKNYIKYLTTNETYIEQLNSNTLYLRIPSFIGESHTFLDKFFADNHDKITKTENLIIDIRDNRGGYSQSFQPLLQLIYTNPYIKKAGPTYIGPLTIKHFKDGFEIHFTDPESWQHQLCKEAYEEYKDIEGEFIYSETPLEDITDKIYDFPKNVGLIINNRSASASEQLSLYAKQSKKTKLFGVPSSGTIDYGNPIPADSPCKEITLIYSSFMNNLAITMPVDYIGIQPDFLIDSSIPDYKWVEYVNDIIQNWVDKPATKKRSRKK